MQHTPTEREVIILLLEGVVVTKLFGILLLGKFVSSLPFIDLFNNLLISVWTHGFLINTWANNF